MKISLITDINGIPIHAQLFDGNMHDSKILMCHMNDKNLLINKKILQKYKKYFLADKGYDSSKVKNMLTNKKYVPIIPVNKRNTKDINKLKVMNKEHKKIFKKRIIIENTFGILKGAYKRLDSRYDKYVTNYESFMFLAFIFLIQKYLN